MPLSFSLSLSLSPSLSLYLSVCLSIPLYLHIYTVYMYTCIHVYIYIYIYMYLSLYPICLFLSLPVSQCPESLSTCMQFSIVASSFSFQNLEDLTELIKISSNFPQNEISSNFENFIKL